MIGKIIASIILNDENISPVVQKVYPISDRVDKTDLFPVIFYVVKLVPDYDKSGQSMQTWIVELLTMCGGYKESWELSMKLKKAFEKIRQSSIDDIRIVNIRCTSITDDYEFNTNSYGQKIGFNIKTVTI